MSRIPKKEEKAWKMIQISNWQIKSLGYELVWKLI